MIHYTSTEVLSVNLYSQRKESQVDRINESYALLKSQLTQKSV